MLVQRDPLSFILQDGATDKSGIHPLGNMNILSYINPSTGCKDISVWTKLYIHINMDSRCENTFTLN